MKHRAVAFFRGALPIDRALAQHTLNRHNNFNLLRILAALAVLFSHCYPLTGNPTEPFAQLTGLTAGTIAVDTFFIISGFLVTTSLIKTANIKVYLLSRAIRIFPALAVAAMFCVFVVGPIFTRLSLGEYFTDKLTYKHLLHNSTALFGLKFKLPGVFEGNVYPNAVNGSLWSLRWEIRLYLILALIGWVHFRWPHRFGPRGLKTVILALAVGAMSGYLVKYLGLAGTKGMNMSLHLTAMFFYGAALFCFQHRVSLSARGMLIAVAAMALAVLDRQWFFVAYNLGLGYLVLCLAYLPGGVVRKFNAIGDYSYGIYIYAFPVQQSLMALHPGLEPIQLLATATPVTLVLAMLSWHLLEKPALRIKKRWKPHAVTL